MKQLNMHEAKTQLSKLVQDAEAGEEVYIARDGQPVVRLLPVDMSRPVILGGMKGKFVVPDNFDDPLPDDILRAFEGEES